MMPARNLILGAILLLAVAACLVVGSDASTNSHPQKKTKVIFDTDANHDDVVALLYLIKKTTVDLLGVTVVGNGWGDLGPGVNNFFGLLDMMGRSDVPVAPGYAYAEYELETQNYGCTYSMQVPLQPRGRILADTIVGLSYRLPKRTQQRSFSPYMQNSTQLMSALLSNLAAGEKATILALGPLTNIDMLFKQQPWTKSKIERIIVMGGAVYVPGDLFYGHGNTVAESNIYGDPQAAESVFASGVPITLVPCDPANALPPVGDGILQRMAAVTTYEGRLVHDLMFTMLDTATIPSKYHIWDVIAAGVLYNEAGLMSNVTDLPIRVVTDTSQWLEVGATVIDPVHGHNMHVILTPNLTAFPDDLVNTLSSPVRTAPIQQVCTPILQQILLDF